MIRENNQTDRYGMVIGANYAASFGLDPSRGERVVWNGGSSWTCTNTKGESKTADAPEMTAAIRYTLTGIFSL